MSNITIATLPKLTRENLAALMQSTPLTPASDSPVAVVDVRDSDHVGGHILGSVHAPTPTLDWRMPELVRELKDKERVVFHCALSQQRGPSAALRYLRERERMFPGARASAQTTTAGGAESNEGGSGSAELEARKQKIYVLEGGFTQWQEKYGKDKRLTEAYNEELWKYGY